MARRESALGKIDAGAFELRLKSINSAVEILELLHQGQCLPAFHTLNIGMCPAINSAEPTKLGVNPNQVWPNTPKAVYRVSIGRKAQDRAGFGM